MKSQPKLNSQQTSRVLELFDQVSDLDGEEQEAFLQRACQGDQTLYDEVKQLLAEFSAPDDFLEHSAISVVTRVMSQEVTPLRPGTRLGKYEILKELGRGGMGDVFQARSDIGLIVAIKVLPDYYAQDPERLSRFESEARKVAQLQHPNIAGIHSREFEDGWRFLVLEYVEGETLEGRLVRGPLPLREALTIFQQIADALAATHQKDIVHRDLKPSNIMLTTGGQVKLLDFGIAKHFRHAEPLTQEVAKNSMLSTLTQSLTAVGFTPGTLPYMSPEQMAGEKTDQATDLWALGVVMYEALTGYHPFRRETREETSQAIAYALPSWKRLPSNTPRDVRELLKRCLTKEPERRLCDAAEVKQILAQAQQDLERGFDFWHLWRQLLSRFNQRTLLSFTCGVALCIGLIGYYVYSKNSIHITVLPDQTDSCLSLNAQAFAKQLDGLSRVSSSLGNADGVGYVLEFKPQCNEEKKQVLLRLRKEGLTVIALLAEQAEPAVKKLAPVLEAMATRPGEKLSPRDAQINLIAPSLTNLTPETQQVLNLDNWDNAGMVDAALQVVNDLIKQSGESATLLAALSRAHLYRFKLTQQSDDKQKAYDAFVKALTLTPDSFDALVAAGEYNTSFGAAEAASRNFQQALQQRRYDALATRGLARAYEVMKQYDQAEALFLLAMAYRPEYWGGYNELGNYYSERGEHLLATEYLTTATKLWPSTTTYSNLGTAYFYQQRYPEALQTYAEATHLNADAYLGRGMIYYLDKKYSEAEKDFRRGRDVSPNLPEAWGYLGQALHWLPSRQTESKIALQKAIELAQAQLDNKIDPVDKETMTALLAMWKAIAGQTQEAVTTINELLKAPANQDDPEMLLRAAIVHTLARQEPIALSYVQSFLQKGGTEQELEQEPFLDALRKNKLYQSTIENHSTSSPTIGDK